MKKWLILAYIISVLAISGLAKAANLNALIDSYQYNENLLSLSISGSVNGNCGVRISSVIIASQATEELPVLLIEADNNIQNCELTDSAANQFDITVDLRSVGVKKNTSYYVMFNNFFRNNIDPLFEIKIPKEISENIPHTKDLRGILKKDTNCNFYLDINGSLFSVKSIINLEKYLNSKVVINSLTLTYQVEPGFNLNSRSPLRENSENQPTDIYALGISTI